MAKEKVQKRFVRVLEESDSIFGPDCSLIADRETGVTYLIVGNSLGCGVTPLIDASGKPVITRVDESTAEK